MLPVPHFIHEVSIAAPLAGKSASLRSIWLFDIRSNPRPRGHRSRALDPFPHALPRCEPSCLTRVQRTVSPRYFRGPGTTMPHYLALGRHIKAPSMLLCIACNYQTRFLKSGPAAPVGTAPLTWAGQISVRIALFQPIACVFHETPAARHWIRLCLPPCAASSPSTHCRGHLRGPLGRAFCMLVCAASPGTFANTAG